MDTRKTRQSTGAKAITIVSFVALLLALGGAVLAQDPIWTELPLPVSEGWLSGLHFVDKDTGWIVGNEGSGEESRPVILHTADGGETWVEQDSGIEQGAISDVFFLDAETGYVVGQEFGTGYPLILRTTDGGSTWSPATIPDVHGSLGSVTFTEDGIGWSSGIEFDNFQSLLLRSEDGVNWTVQDHPAKEGARLSTVAFLSSVTGFATGSTLQMSPEDAPQISALWTTDGGDTWTEMTLPVDEGGLSDVFFVDGSTGWLVGGADEAFILKTTDGGITWAPLDTPPGTMAMSVFFISPEEGFVAINRQEGDTWSGTLYQTDDGGETWTTLLDELPGEAILQIQVVRGSVVVYTVGIDKKNGRPVVRKGVVPPPGKPEPADPTPQPTKDTTDGPDDDDDQGPGTLAEIVVAPQGTQLSVGQAQQYTAAGRDRDKNKIPITPVWSASGGTIDASGLFTATAKGTFVITASVVGSPVTGSAIVQVDALPPMWIMVIALLTFLGVIGFLVWYLFVGRHKLALPWLWLVVGLIFLAVAGFFLIWFLAAYLAIL